MIFFVAFLIALQKTFWQELFYKIEMVLSAFVRQFVLYSQVHRIHYTESLENLDIDRFSIYFYFSNLEID